MKKLPKNFKVGTFVKLDSSGYWYPVVEIIEDCYFKIRDSVQVFNYAHILGFANGDVDSR